LGIFIFFNEFLTGFFPGSLYYVNIAGCPIEAPLNSSATGILSLPPHVNISTMAYLGLHVPVYTSLLSLISWTQKNVTAASTLRISRKVVTFVCRPTRRMYGSIEVPTQMRSVTTNLFSLRELGTATQLVQVTMRFALARRRDIKELSQAYDL
jgi:hypothetical protein